MKKRDRNVGEKKKKKEIQICKESFIHNIATWGSEIETIQQMHFQIHYKPTFLCNDLKIAMELLRFTYLCCLKHYQHEVICGHK